MQPHSNKRIRGVSLFKRLLIIPQEYPKMNERQRQRWQKIRAKGKARYVLTRGVFSYAMIPVIARILVQLYYFFATGVPESLFKNKIEFAFKVLLFGIWGYASARKDWQRHEKAYLKDQESASNIPQAA
jgi:hypothetical protein